MINISSVMRGQLFRMRFLAISPGAILLCGYLILRVIKPIHSLRGTMQDTAEGEGDQSTGD